MKVYWDPICMSHNPSHEILSGRLVPYFESPERVKRIKRCLEQDDTFQMLPIDVDWTNVKEHILEVHTKEYVDYLEAIYDEWVAVGGDKSAVFPETFRHRQLQEISSQDASKMSPLAKPGNYCFDMSCPITSDTYGAAIASVKVTLCAARALAEDADSLGHRGVFALARPPGHHAQDALCGGYCFLNNAAIAAKYFLKQPDCHRVAILDVDYHHGNGTQQIFYSTSQVVYVSLHAQGDYPYFSGSTEECGIDEGMGYNHNFPLPIGTTDDVYCNILQDAVDIIRTHNDVNYLIVSLGMDTYSEDPISEFLLTQSCYRRIGNIVASLKKPTLFVMPGGYHLDSLGKNVRSSLVGFEEANSTEDDAP